MYLNLKILIKKSEKRGMIGLEKTTIIQIIPHIGRHFGQTWQKVLRIGVVMPRCGCPLIKGMLIILSPKNMQQNRFMNGITIVIFLQHLIAAKKQGRTWLDPYEIEDNWFELDLLTLELKLTDNIPDEIRPIAEETLARLKLDKGTAIIRQREAWYQMYQEGLPIEMLHKKAPLIAQAIERERERRG